MPSTMPKTTPRTPIRGQPQQHRYHSAVCLHEVWHAAVAAANHLAVRRVDVLEGYCEIAWPFEPEGLQEAFRDPPRAHRALVATCGCIAAQAFGEGLKFPGKACPWTCHDARLLARFQAAYGALPSRLIDYNRQPHVKPPWAALLEEARAAVRTWSQRPGAPLALLALAGELGQAGVLDHPAWSRLMRSPLARPLHFRVATEKRRYWVLGTSKSAPCTECRQVEAVNAGGVAPGEDFVDPVGEPVTPPLHKHCVCRIEER